MPIIYYANTTPGEMEQLLNELNASRIQMVEADRRSELVVNCVYILFVVVLTVVFLVRLLHIFGLS